VMLSVCEKFDIRKDFQNLLKVSMGNNLEKKGYYCSALKWFMQAGDVIQATRASTILLDNIINRINLVDVALIQMTVNALQKEIPEKKIGTSLRYTNQTEGDDLKRNLIFIYLFNQIVIAYQEEKYEIVQSGIISLLKDFSPNRYWLFLLLDAKLLIETKKVIFAPLDLTTLMDSLAHLSNIRQHSNFREEKEDGIESWPNIQHSLRKAFVQNFSTSILRNSNFGIGSNNFTGITAI